MSNKPPPVTCVRCGGPYSSYGHTCEVKDNEPSPLGAASCSACGLPWDRHPGIAGMCGKFCHVVDTLGWVIDKLKHHHRRRPGINAIIEEVDRRMATKPNKQISH